MKVGAICCFALTGLMELIDASFVIQKMKAIDSKSSRKSLQRGSVTHGRSLISSISQGGGNKFEILQRSGNESSRKSQKSNKNLKIPARTDRKSQSRKSYTDRNYKSKLSTKSKSRNSRNSIRSVGSRSGLNILSSIGKSGKSFSISTSKVNAGGNRKSSGVSFSYTKGSASKSQNSKFTKQKNYSAFIKKPSASKTTVKSANNVTIDDFVYVDLPKNQWTEFYFSEVGQLPYSRWTFDIPANQQCTLQVVDSFCTGDRFQATRRLDSGVEIPLLSTPPVPYDPIVAEQIKLGANVNCTPFTTDAETAWASSSWSKGQVLLTQSGNYKLILKSLLAPYGSGGAFVRLDCPSTPTPSPSQNVCTYGSSTIKYIRQFTTFPQQSAVCQSFGYSSLAVNTSNSHEARKVLINCAGAETRAWIASYNGDNYGGTIGLTLHATLMSESGAITATPDTSALQGVLCQ